ncbi:hypothetical protein QAD02_009716 [Eretmocerus hayati]|uniref:Uncharacterized protein n=1 Tax=Eretmocerus hayati TaxID=131215 RepID=A0ACC2NAU2_9HYME|nr:hypothetical protein QAD02_009716 [Eretmocerus hayati]
MNRVGIFSVLLGLLMPLATHGGTKGTIRKELAVNYTRIGSPLTFPNPLFVDKYFMFTICNSWFGYNATCQVHVVKVDGPEEVHSFKYEPSPGRGIRAISNPNFVRNGFFLLTTEVNVNSGEYVGRSEHVSGFVFNPTLDKLFNLELPSDMYDQHIIGSGVKSDELVVVLGNHTICAKFNRCMLRFNTEGQRIGEPILFPFQYDKLLLFPRQGGSVNEGLFGIGTIVERDSSFSQVFYVTANNEPIIIDTINYPITDFKFSNTRDMYGICVRKEHDETMIGIFEYKCFQYDWKLNKTTHFNMNTTFGYGQTEGTIVVSIKNLNSNSLLFTSLECHGHGTGEPGDYDCRTARISVVNSDDQILRSKEILTNLECHNTDLISSGITEMNDEYCFYLSCLNAVDDPEQSYSHGSYLYVKCLPMSDI